MAGENESGIGEDEPIASLVPDPSQVPDARILLGFLGRSSRKGFWRVYTTLELNEYVEFSAEDVLHSQTLTTSENPLGGSAVWLKREANMVYTCTTSREAQAEFLGGEISGTFLRGQSLGAVSTFRALIAIGLAASGNGVCTLDSKCITTVDPAPLCPKLTLPISTSKCACLVA